MHHHLPRRCLAFLLTLLVAHILGCAASNRDQHLMGDEGRTQGLSVGRLSCEGRPNPLAVDSLVPRLSWVLTSAQRGQHQSAYRVLVASSPAMLAKNNGDLWDSGKVGGTQTLNIPYAGRPLASEMPCHWKVQVWDREGQSQGWSEPAMWEVALQRESDWAAEWINDGKANPLGSAAFDRENPASPAPLFRKEFVLSKPLKRARLHITGLGYYEATLNGRRVGDHVLDPGWTAYDHRVLYSTYDVTDQLRNGDNCLGVMVGNGWYNPLPMKMWGRLNLRESLAIGRPRFIARLSLEYTDGTRQAIVSDLSWKAADGPIRFNNVYLGEVYDARREQHGWDKAGFDDSAWRKPAIAPEPVGPLLAQSQPPIRVKERIRALRVTEPQPGVFIYDMGQNFTGWAAFEFRKPLPAPGTTIVIRYGELLNADGTLNAMTSVAGQIKGRTKNASGEEESVGGAGAPPIAWQTDTYITRGGTAWEIYTPRFTFHGYRYVEVTGLPTIGADGASPTARLTVTGLRLHSDVADSGSFACSNELFNRIQEMCRHTFLANIFSVQSDCPHRERFGYGGDIVATSEALMLNFDMSWFYAKTVRDFTDAARPDGLFTDTAPFVGIQYCGVGWAMAQPLLLSQLRREYGDERLMVEHYDAARRWLLRVAQDNPSGLIDQGLSDHEGLEEAPPPQMVTPLYVQSAEMLGAMARVLHRDADAAMFESLATASRAAYQHSFPIAPTTSNTQASLAFALYTGLVPDAQRIAAMDALIEKIQIGRKGHLSTGIMGTKFMLDVLSRMGRSDVAYDIVNRRDFPGWGWMLENGATTLWEHWELSDNTFSHSHPMFGSVSQWFFNWLGGIQPGTQAEGKDRGGSGSSQASGYDSIIIRPQPVADLTWVRSSHRTPRGVIVSNWLQEDEGDDVDHAAKRLTMEVEIPIGTTALVYIPADAIEHVTESGLPLGISLAPSKGATPPIAGDEVEVVRFEPPSPSALKAPGPGLPLGAIVCRVGPGRYVFVSAHTPRNEAK